MGGGYLMNNKYTHKKGIVYLNQYHIVFCPKYRRKVLVGDIERDLRQILYDIAKEKDVEIKALEIMPDHVHMFISFDRLLWLLMWIHILVAFQSFFMPLNKIFH